MKPITNYTLERVATDGDWKSYHAIRRKVLWEDRGLMTYDATYPDEYLPDNHALLFKLNGQPIGTTRLDDFKNGSGAVRLVAIHDQYQRQGHGRQLTMFVEAYAQKLGIKTLHVNAAPEALGYYQKLGWTSHIWDSNELTGIAADCLQMRKTL